MCKKWNKVANLQIIWKNKVMAAGYGTPNQHTFILTQPIIIKVCNIINHKIDY